MILWCVEFFLFILYVNNDFFDAKINPSTYELKNLNTFKTTHGIFVSLICQIVGIFNNLPTITPFICQLPPEIWIKFILYFSIFF